MSEVAIETASPLHVHYHLTLQSSQGPTEQDPVAGSVLEPLMEADDGVTGFVGRGPCKESTNSTRAASGSSCVRGLVAGSVAMRLGWLQPCRGASLRGSG